jgi:hypothetical protein
MPYISLMMLVSNLSKLPLGLIGMFGFWLTKVKGLEKKT